MNPYKEITISILCVTVTLLCQMVQAEDQIPEILKRVSVAETNGSEKECIILLRDIGSIEDANLFSFGAGLGPTTRESLLFSAVLSLWPKLKSASTDPLPSDPLWLRVLLESDIDDENIEIALTSMDPVTRLASLLRIRQRANLSDKAINSLSSIASGDSYFQIQRQQVPSEDGRPSPPGQTENVIVAPLRQLAEREIKTRGMPPIKKTHPSDEEASKWIAKLDARESLTLEDIRFALTQLSPKGPRMKLLKEAAVLKDTSRMEQLRLQYRQEKIE